MPSARDKSEEMAIRNLQEADLWWNQFQSSTSKYRQIAIYYLAHIRCLRMAETWNMSPARIRRIRASMDFAHDRMLIISDEIDSLSNSAISCEMASRIYFEDCEGRHWDD